MLKQNENKFDETYNQPWAGQESNKMLKHWNFTW